MSANMLMNRGNTGCAECGSYYGNLDMKASTDGETYYCRCIKCGYEDFYVFPKTCLHCDFDDWQNYYAGEDYPENCPSCEGKW